MLLLHHGLQFSEYGDAILPLWTLCDVVLVQLYDVSQILNGVIHILFILELEVLLRFALFEATMAVIVAKRFYIGENLLDAGGEVAEHALMEDVFLLDGEVDECDVDFVLVKVVEVRVA